MAGHKRSTIIAGRDDKVVQQSPEWESNGQQLREILDKTRRERDEIAF